jgi:ribosomal protein S18 acetylase RimI-like enzyme
VTPTVQRRAYAGPQDVRAMQDLAARAWTPASRWHVGDLAWGRFQHTGRERRWPTALWEAGGRVVAFGWARLPGELDLLVDPDHAELAGDVLAWFEQVATAGELAVTVGDAEPQLTEALRRRGYAPAADDAPFFVRLTRSLADLPRPEVPARFAVRHVRDGDLTARVAVHRAAFAPSLVTVDSYRNVMAAHPYRPELDWVVQAPDRRLAAFCLGWLDERNWVGELEPVGTHPEYRRLGLARAACLAAMAALRAAGAGWAVVDARGDAGHPGPLRLYRGLGFAPASWTRTWTRPRAAGAGPGRPGGVP